jgi:Ser/Thr protein kinase RdoA (MazF antagonist)
MAEAPDATPYARLTPELVLAAVERVGFPVDGRVLALGSYENRVYQVGREDGDPVVLKFYRPGRWSDAAILEEHAFALELAAAEIPVVAPLLRDGETLHRHSGYRYAVFPRRGGRWPELGTADDRVLMGRFLGRMHRLGQARSFAERPRLADASAVRAARATVLAGGWLPDYLQARYEDITDAIESEVDEACTALMPRLFRIHGDCHRGNVLWTEQGPHFVDLDDCQTGPAIQDLWMLLAGSESEMRGQCRDLLEGYSQFAEFERAELRLIEPLRALRMVHYAAWIARRWEDPAFPLAFPWFDSPRYWENHLMELGQQLEALGQPPLSL